MAYFPRWEYGDDYTEWNYPTGIELAEYLKEELVGKKITYMDDTLIELDNGRVLEIAPNVGCDCCPNGNASIAGDSVRAASESAILDVKYSEWETHGESSSFGIFILTANKHESNLYDTVSISGYGRVPKASAEEIACPPILPPVGVVHRCLRHIREWVPRFP